MANANFIYLNDVLLPLSHMLGEESIPASVPNSRNDAVQYALNRIFRLQPFDWEQLATTIAMSGGLGTIPNTYRFDPEADVRVLGTSPGGDIIFDYVDPQDFDNYVAGDQKYTILYTTGTGVMKLQITDTQYASVQFTGQLAAPTISNSVGVTFPNAEVVAAFALIFLRRWEDKDADTSVEEAEAMQAFNELQTAEQRSKGPTRAKTRQEVTGHYTGEVKEDPYSSAVYY